MAWAKLSTTTLASANSTVSSDTITAKKFIQDLFHDLGSAYNSSHLQSRFNSDSTSSYALRYSNNGTEGTGINVSVIYYYINTVNNSNFVINYTMNISNEEKLVIGFKVEQNTAGAGNAPNRLELTGKWTNTSAQITNISYVLGGSDTHATNSNLSALGTD